MPEKKPTEEQTNEPVKEQTAVQANKPAKERKKLDKKSIITIVVAIIVFLAILFGVLAACGVFNKNTGGDNTAKITITIEVNGGTGNYNDITFDLNENNTYTFTDEEIAAIKDALTKDGYELKGLSTTPDGEGGWTITIPKDAESPVKLYAIWEENEPQPELAIFTHEGGVITGLTEYGKTLSTITIPGTLDGEAITSIGSNAFKNNETITSVTIPNTVMSIGTGAFMGCKSLTSIKIPDGVTSITHDVFSQCSSLKSIEIPSSLTNVGHGTFYGCPLTAVYFNGTSDEWNVYIDNSAVSNGNFTTEIVYYYSVNPPEIEGNFWHLVEGVPTVWVVDLLENARLAAWREIGEYVEMAKDDLDETSEVDAELIRLIEDVQGVASFKILEATEIDGDNGITAIKEAAIAEIIELDGFAGWSLENLKEYAQLELSEYIEEKEQSYNQEGYEGLHFELEQVINRFTDGVEHQTSFFEVRNRLNECKAEVDSIVASYQ